MAVIVEDTRLTIATRLANLNYKEKLDALREKLNEAIEKRFIEKTPEDVLACFKAHKEFFLRCNEATLSSYNLPKGWFPEDWGSRTIYIRLKFSCDIPYEDENVKSYIGKLKDNDSIASLVKEYLIVERDRYHMEKRLKCLMKMTRFTPTRLQEEFPEAYLIYMDIIEKNDDAKKPASNLCDTIENIRATLKPDLKEALKNAKEEE
jgi:hypothetical protein